jgi:hypothetical protein
MADRDCLLAAPFRPFSFFQKKINRRADLLKSVRRVMVEKELAHKPPNRRRVPFPTSGKPAARAANSTERQVLQLERATVAQQFNDLHS